MLQNNFMDKTKVSNKTKGIQTCHAMGHMVKKYSPGPWVFSRLSIFSFKHFVLYSFIYSKII